MIRSFRCAETGKIFGQERSRRFGNLAGVALRKLIQLNRASRLENLRLPGNRLHPLTGDRAGQYSLAVKEQYRICFRWADGDAYDVEIVDYH